jgi:hypothetical protein
MLYRLQAYLIVEIGQATNPILQVKIRFCMNAYLKI